MINKILTIVLLILASICFFSIKSCKHNQAEKTRLEANQNSLLTHIQFYRTKDSLSAASVQRLTLTGKEFKKYNTELEQTVRDLNIKIKRIQSLSQTATEQQYSIKTIIKDSIINHRDTIQCIDYTNPYIDFTGCTQGDTLQVNITVRDTLIQIVHRIPRKFLFIKYGTKAIRQEITTKNPHSTIQYTEYIELRK